MWRRRREEGHQPWCKDSLSYFIYNRYTWGGALRCSSDDGRSLTRVLGCDTNTGSDQPLAGGCVIPLRRMLGSAGDPAGVPRCALRCHRLPQHSSTLSLSLSFSRASQRDGLVSELAHAAARGGGEAKHLRGRQPVVARVGERARVAHAVLRSKHPGGRKDNGRFARQQTITTPSEKGVEGGRTGSFSTSRTWCRLLLP